MPVQAVHVNKVIKIIVRIAKKWQEKYPGRLLNHHALYTYNEMARDYMDQYKFQGDLLLADILVNKFMKH